MLQAVSRKPCQALLRRSCPSVKPFDITARRASNGCRRAPIAFSTSAGAGGNPEVKINIEGMMCDGCSSRIENVLKGMDTVKAVSVSLEGKVAVVQLAKGEPASPEALAAAAALVDTINGLGFEAKLSK